MNPSKHSTGKICTSAVVVLGVFVVGSHAWTIGRPTTTRPLLSAQRRHGGALFMAGDDDKQNSGGGPFSFLTNPYESRIPPDLQAEIYAAEANTSAAQERGARVATYATIAFVGVLFAFFSAFITELRNSPLPEGAPEGADPLVIAGFDWVRSNPITGFLFTNKLGGGICLLGGAGAGLMAEAELDTKRINAEKIFQEMERRRGSKAKRQPKRNKGKKRRSGKEKKRMAALSEIVAEDPKQAAVESKETAMAKDAGKQEEQSAKPVEEKQEESIFGKMKGFYDKADSMAASQALLLNKELEDRGIVDKITDESGLKVIGRDDAAKLEEKKEGDERKEQESSK